MAAACTIALLTGCTPADEPPVTSATTTASAQPAASDWWDSPEHEERAEEDNLARAFVMVDPNDEEQTTDYKQIEGNQADDPLEPAPIAPSGNIRIGVLFESKPLYRQITESYISTDPEGKEAGPPMVCNNFSLEGSQGFRCKGEFQDKNYTDGIYYAVFVTMPLSEEDSRFGQRSLIVPVYTRLPGENDG
ncbi:hypothetical protein BWO91_17660 [Plantibacter flavus]|nr:hypothetical protein BWO91_17660 [Plantibacter flavus]